MKRGMNRFFSILLVLCMLISMIPMTAFAATPDVLYLKPNSNWLAEDARFAAYFYGNGESWASMTDSDGDGIYECAVPSGFTSVIFCRMNPGSSTNSWDNKWNQSSDLTIPTDGTNCFTVAEDTWDAGGGSWSTFSNEYYLFGFINGANYGCEEDAANLGEFKFSSAGKLSATFQQESYVGVKTGDNANWYMTEGFQGTSKTLTLYNTNSGIVNPDKAYVPAGIKVNFTLTKNTDGTLQLKYSVTKSTCQHLFYTNGKCNACAVACTHSYSGGRCTICGLEEASCSHSYTSEVTTAATCTATGVKTYTCSKCGDSYTETIAATGHSYTDGSCTVCGAYDPNYTVTDTGFVLVTDPTQISAGGKFVIVANNSGTYQAMGTTLSSGKFAPVTVTVDGRVVTGSDLPVWNIEAVTGGIAIRNDSGYLTYNSSTNFKLADAAYTWTVNGGTDGYILHASATSRGIYYQISSAKFGAYSTSYVNSNSYISNLQLYKYQVGTQGCSHSYTSEVTTEATCETAGVKTFTCSLCDHSYTETIAATGHSYTDGICSVCGAADPNYNLTYYLVGFINGANHGCEEDASNMGSCQFASGKLTATFTADSYVFVKTENNGKWFMAESYCTDTTCKMVEGGTEKLYVPGGIKVTFTLTENSDGSLTLKYTKTASSCQHLTHSQDGICNACGKTVSHSYSSGTCTVCGAAEPVCSHSYTSQVTTAATCTTAGEKTFTCSKCGDSYTESIAATGHKYSNGSCTVCGAYDPNYTVTDTGFVLVTDPTQISAGGKFVIVANNSGTYQAMGSTIASGKFAAVTVTVDGRIVTGSDLPIWNIEAVSGGIAIYNDSGYLAYNSSTNFKFADAAYTWTVNGGTSGYILHNTDGARGIYYQLSTAKFGAYAATNVNSASYVSNLQLYKYQVGTQGCSHSYSSKVTTEATCEKAGVKTFTCGLCGDSYTESIAATGHSYTDGTCSVCGAADPNYNLTYYLVGFINGANHGCEEDAGNMGSYQFASGKLTATFTADSYVFIKTENNGKWFMAESYCTDTTCKMVEGGNEKLYVPGGVEVIFTLTENTDGSLTLKYTISSCQHPTHSQDGKCNICGSTVSHSYVNGSCSVCGAQDPNGTITDTGFVLVTDAAQITAGGKFVIVANDNGTYQAMGTTLASGKLAPVTVTVDGRVVTGSDLPVWTVEAVSGGIALSLDGSYLSYNSSTNFKMDTAAYTWTVTEDDSGYILNSAATTRGIYYSVSAAKFGAYSTSYVSSSSYVSNLQLYKYQVGTQGCSHSYSSKVTTEATCEKAGVKTFTCSLCGDSYTETIAATGHSYTDGSCTVCGAADPGYSVDYYLVGFINGANHGCEEDAANMGSYKFSGGKLTATFTQDSFVFVKTANNGKWYLPESYCTDTTCKMVIGGGEKLYVPGGIKVTFTLTENSDGSITLKYTKTASSCQHLMHSQEGICNACGKTVSHSWSSGACSVCGLVCSHASHDQNGICGVCGVSVSHSYSGNTCTVCGKVTAASTVKVHFVDAVVWQNVTAYIWKSSSSGDTALNSWPGEILNKDANGYFTIELDYKPVSGESLGFIFTNFNGGQTADTIVDYSTLSSGEIWIKPNNWTNGDGKYDCYVTTVESSMYISPEINGTSVTFRYENADASKVYVAGSFNGWSTTANKLTKGADGFWSTTVTLSEGVYEYKLVVDDEWILDPRNGLIGGYDGNSLAIVGNAGSATSGNVTVKLHFYRESGDYANWDAWLWSSTNEGQGCAFYDDPVYKGKTATFTIPGGTNAWVNYKIRKTDWSDEEFYTRSIDISNIQSGTVHFFLNSGSATGSTVYGNDVIKMGKPTYANLDYNSGNIWVKTPLPVTGDFTKAFSVLKSDGSASGISVTGVTMDNNGYSLALSRKPALIEIHDLVVKCGTTVAIETDGLFYSSGFAADYTYYGNDLGATWSKNSTTFKVWAPTATGVSVILYRGGNHGGDDWISTTPMTLGEKGVYTVTVSGDLDGTYYNYLVNFPGYTTEATDPYAKTTGANGDRGMIINMDAYDPEGWDNDISPNKGLNYTDAIIYEMHIREMTIDASSGVKEEWRGKYLGLTQEGTNYQGRATALDHIKELGVTHVQLMPTYDHAGVDEYHLTDWQQYAWGYNPKNFNVPEGSFATDPYNGEVRVTEMKQMVQAFHSNGINVVMDVVYNHTFSGGDFCYNKIVPNYFSRFWGENNWSNGSGVGNDFATERSMGRNYIVDSIFYWVEEYHIDGFRFDLAGLIDIQTMNEVISTVQARYPYVIFYGEGWTVGGTAIQDGHWTATKENAWQTGSLAFYNDTFRNDIAGDNGNSWGFATGDSGKADKMGDYFRASNGWSSSPSQTINYVSCHDNYTLIDKIIISRNGAYWDQMVKMNNMSAAIYMLAQGIPYIYSGEELLREKKDEWGNRYHNTYDSSDYVTKIRWSDLVDKEFAQVTDDYYAGLVNFRKNHAALRCPGGGDAWGYTSFHKINDHCILFYVSGYPNYECSDGIVIIYNANEGTQWLNIYDYGVPYGYWQATIHGMTAGVNPLWGTSDGSVGVEGLSTTVLVLGDLIHEESVYNNQSFNCDHAYHNQSGLCWDCGAEVSHYFVNGYCNHCNLAQLAADPVTVYYDNSGTNWGNVYAYAWTEVGGRTVTYTNAWPGNQMTNISGNVFAVTVPRAASHIIFTDNYGNQSVAQGIIKDDNGNVTANIHYSSDGTWGSYTEACSHPGHDSQGVCTSCGIEVGHNWQSGYCSGCKTTCTHSEHSKSGLCYTCGMTVSHSWNNGTCTACGTTCSHNWSSGKCSTCGMSCGHSGHDQNGSCYTCGHNVGHSYSGGLCSACGAYKQGYIESQSYYLVGYINGSNYGCEEDYQNLGSYKFSGGKLTATFNSDSYVYVKTGDNASHYMTDGYQDGATSVTLHDSRTVSGDKLYVPGGKEVTFTLTVNSSNNTMVLSYVETNPTCSHSYTSKVTTAATCTAAGVKTFTCSKCGDSYTQTIAATGHNYTSQVTTAATCTKEGMETYTCSNCGNSYTQAIPVIAHNYSNGSCTSCGAPDPSYTVTDTGFVLVTNVSQITSGGKFVLVANNNGTYQAMGTTLSSGKFAPVTVTVDGRIVTGDNLPVWTVEAVDGGIALSIDGSYLSYNSSTNFKTDTAAYAWTVTEGDSGFILNSAATTRGIYYSISAAKFGAYSTSYVNSASYISNLQLYKYQVGTQGCAHSYTSKVTTAATCTAAGVKTFTCSLCDYSYTESIPATGHSFANGSCTVCGAADPSAPVDYYLFGYINGADCGVGDDLNNTGEYKFVNGKLTVTFTEESYVAVKTGDNAAFYMTNGWIGAVTSATLYKFTDPNATSANKLQIPGGQTVTFTLSENWDGNLNISYVVESATCTHISHNTDGICTTCGATVEHTFVSGVCTVCYQAQEGYDPYDYYLYGYINGANYGCEEDAANLGSYLFTEGKLTVTFDADSYIGVKEVYPNGKYGAEVMAWYVTDGWLGTEITTATLYKSTAVAVGDKLFVPGGVELTFTLAKNADGTVTLSYTENGPTVCDHSYTSKVTTAATCTANGVKTYTCSKCGDSYTEAIAATGHKYSAGSCTVCGALDPNYSVTDTGYVRVFDATKLTSGKYVIVANNGTADLAMDTTLTSGKFAGTAVTVNGALITGSDLPVWTLEMVDGGITLSLDGQYLAYNTSTNFKLSADPYVWTAENGDTGIILHSSATTRGIYLQISSSKFGAYATSNVGSASYVSNLQLYKYQVGTQGCAHSYTSKVTTAATCTTAGVKTFTCGLCGHSYTETIAATGHSYENGSCTVCGAADPSVPVDYTYYLVGYINGADYGCEGDWENMGIYKFVDGKLTATFTEDSYIFVKTEGNGKWLLAEAYTEATSCTFKVGGTEKMFIPGGNQVTFTLTENADGSVTVSYTLNGAYSCDHSYSEKITTPATCTTNGVKTFTCTKCGDVYTVTFAANGHSYTSKVTTAATCTVNGVKTFTCSGCNDQYTEVIAAAGHKYSNGKCTVCGNVDPNCSHSYTSKVTTSPTCTATGLRTYTCTKCGDVYNETIAAKGHSFVDTVVPPTCELNGYTTHKCSVCGVSNPNTDAVSPIGHNYSEFVVTAPTCTEQGYTTYTCANCGNVKVWDYTAATGHSYSNGKCTGCGQDDPSIGNSIYYLVGYINGADYGCEGDWENMGIYKFVNGKLTATFTEDSYIFLKTGNNNRWLLSDAYCTDTTCTFREGGSEKMFVPGGVELTFTLTENADGSVTVSYTMGGTAGCDHSYTSKVTTAATCTKAGVMTYTCSKCSASYTQTIPATGHQFSNGSCTVCGTGDPSVVGNTYYLVGYINGADYGCEADYENMGSYKFVNGKLTATFTDDSYIFVKTEGNGKWLLADAYCTDTTCTFREGGTEKMWVPGNVQVTFTLTENADGSVTLSYTTNSGSASTAPTLALKGPSLEFKDMIKVVAFYTAENLQDVTEMGMITYSSNVGTPNIATAENVLPGASYDASTGYYYSTSQGIHAKYLADTVYLAIYAKLSDGSYVYTKLVFYSPVTYAMNQLNYSGDASLKQLVAAMLNYGAEAQLYFGYNTGALANASMTAAQKALPETYRSDMVSAVPTAPADKQGVFANNSGFASRRPAVSFEGAFCINYFFTPAYVPATGVTMYYWTAEDYAANSVLTPANATGYFMMTGSGTGQYRGDLTGIAAKQLTEAVYVAAAYKDSSGTIWTSGVLGYSIGAYCSSQVSQGTTVADLAKATAVYGYHAKQYFG